jgi:hypothetical protein
MRNRKNHEHDSESMPELTASRAVAVVKTNWTQEERRALVEQARSGDKSVRGELRAMLSAHPETVRRLVNRAASVAGVLLKQIAPEADLLATETLEAYATLLVTELEGEHPTALERLLCERVVGYWMASYLLDTTVPADPTVRLSTEYLEFYQAQKDRAAERFLHASVALARVRCSAVVTSKVPLLSVSVRRANCLPSFAPRKLHSSVSPVRFLIFSISGRNPLIVIA